MIQLHNSDCIDILKTMKDNSVDLVVTDPPYKIDVHDFTSKFIVSKGITGTFKEIYANNLHNSYDFEVVNKELIRVMRGINIYVWGSKLQIPDYFSLYVDKLNCKFDILCWHKTNPMPLLNQKYINDTEYCLHFYKDSYGVKPECVEDASTYYLSAINVTDKKKYGHPTIKPLDFIMRIIRNSSQIGDTVLDPFMGSGTTGVACKELNRSFIGIEIESKWYNVAKERIEEEVFLDGSERLNLTDLL